VLRLAQIEVADATDEQVGDAEVEKSPKNIDHRRGQTFAGRGRERALEGMTGDSVAEMGKTVGEK